MDELYQANFLLLWKASGQPTLLRVRGAASAVPIRGDSLGASLELREELLLENSLLPLLRPEVR